MHQHRWYLRDDGQYECACGVIITKDQLAPLATATIQRVKLSKGETILRFNTINGVIEFEGTPEELLLIYDKLIYDKKRKECEKK
jgi:hypothetical protein